jgi:hypothetical protein
MVKKRWNGNSLKMSGFLNLGAPWERIKRGGVIMKRKDFERTYQLVLVIDAILKSFVKIQNSLFEIRWWKLSYIARSLRKLEIAWYKKKLSQYADDVSQVISELNYILNKTTSGTPGHEYLKVYVQCCQHLLETILTLFLITYKTIQTIERGNPYHNESEYRKDIKIFIKCRDEYLFTGEKLQPLFERFSLELCCETLPDNKAKGRRFDRICQRPLI